MHRWCAKEVRKREAQLQGSSLLRLAQSAPFGPGWISASFDALDPKELPAIVTAVVTRRVRGLLLAELIVVDRTCLGVKNAMLLPKTRSKPRARAPRAGPSRTSARLPCYGFSASAANAAHSDFRGC